MSGKRVASVPAAENFLSFVIPSLSLFLSISSLVCTDYFSSLYTLSLDFIFSRVKI